MNKQAQDAARYQFLRELFAIDSDDDQAEFAKLARFTGTKFDEFVDNAMTAYEEKNGVAA